MLANVPQNKWHRLFFDNWYTGLDLVKSLYDQVIACVGIVRTNRLPNVKFPTDTALKGKEEEDYFITFFDNRGVTILTSFEAVNPVEVVDYWNRKMKTTDHLLLLITTRERVVWNSLMASWVFTEYIFVPRSGTIVCYSISLKWLCCRHGRFTVGKWKNQDHPKRIFFSWGCSWWRLQVICWNLAGWWKVREVHPQHLSTYYIMSRKTKDLPLQFLNHPQELTMLVTSKYFLKKSVVANTWVAQKYQKFNVKNVKFIYALHQNQTAFTSFMCKSFDGTF